MGSTVAMDQYICGTTQGFLFFCSFYEVLKHANQSTNFCLTTLESWNFSSKERCLSLISVASLVASFPPKNVCGSCQMQWLPSPSLSCIPMVNCIIPTGFSWILCKSNPHQHQNKQAETLKTLLCQGWGSVKLTRLEIFCSDWNGEWSSAMQLSQSENIPLHLCDLLLQNFFFRVWFISLILTLNIAIAIM